MDKVIETLIREIPLVKQMGVQVERLTPQEVVLAAPLELNYNTHGTAFGGSLSTLCTLAGWCSVAARLMERQLGTNIVISQSEIKYLAPVKDDLRVVCHQPEPKIWAEFEAKLLERGKAKIALVCEAVTGSEIGARFTGTYVAMVAR